MWINIFIFNNEFSLSDDFEDIDIEIHTLKTKHKSETRFYHSNFPSILKNTRKDRIHWYGDMALDSGSFRIEKNNDYRTVLLGKLENNPM